MIKLILLIFNILWLMPPTIALLLIIENRIRRAIGTEKNSIINLIIMEGKSVKNKDMVILSILTFVPVIGIILIYHTIKNIIIYVWENAVWLNRDFYDGDSSEGE